MSVRLRFAFAALTMANPGLCAATAVAAPRGSGTCIVHVPEAARRSGLSDDIVTRVMLAETAGNARIVSPKGAMGCMQIMPPTWDYLTGRYNLGADPFDARMNMIGGAMYLAELAARFGWPGALSAYNAGPGRYQRYVRGGVPLPAETIAYAARLGRNAEARPTVAPSPRWQEARLFMTPPPIDGAAMPPPAPIAPTDNVDVRARNLLFPLSGAPDGGNATSAEP
jgi:soluble lytic murein transglycosylase-like protein